MAICRCFGWPGLVHGILLKCFAFVQNAKMACRAGNLAICPNASHLCKMPKCPDTCHSAQMLRICAKCQISLLPCRAGTFLEPLPAAGKCAKCRIASQFFIFQICVKCRPAGLGHDICAKCLRHLCKMPNGRAMGWYLSFCPNASHLCKMPKCCVQLQNANLHESFGFLQNAIL